MLDTYGYTYGSGGNYTIDINNLSIKENERKLLDIIKNKMGISDDDMKSIEIVSQKIRDSNINDILTND